MKRRISLLAVLAIWCTVQVDAQNLDLPKIIPPSPSSMKMQQYGDYPVGNFTGVPDISIPLYTIQEGDLVVPISINYHASGTKVSDLSGFVGLGWILNSGGAVTRTVYGRPDFKIAFQNPLKEAADIDPVYDMTYFHNVEQYGDTEHDIFSYNINSSTGKFVFKKDANRTAMLFPYKPIKISIDDDLWGIDVLQDNGIKYRFGYSLDETGSAVEMGREAGAISAWYITDMVSAINSSNTINFKYVAGAVEQGIYPGDLLIVDDYYSSDNIGACASDITEYPVSSIIPYSEANGYGHIDNKQVFGYTTVVPSEITFRNGKIAFLQNSRKMLDRITIYNSAGEVIKSILFETFPFGDNFRYGLRAVKFLDKDDNLINQYTFNYNNETLELPRPEQTTSIDFWGYYNGAANRTLLPKWTGVDVMKSLPDWEVIEYITIGDADRSPSEEYTKYYVLEGIKYPTGGRSTYEYSLNQDSDGTKGGGLRVTKITNYDENGQFTGSKIYEYTGTMDVRPEKEIFYYTQEGIVFSSASSSGAGFRRRVFSSQSLLNLTPNGSSVVYPYVTEYLRDDKNNISGRTNYVYSYRSREYVQPYYHDANLAIRYFVDVPAHYQQWEGAFQDWNIGQLEYMSQSDNSTGFLKVTENEYEEIIRESVRDFKMYRHGVWSWNPHCPMTSSDELLADNRLATNMQSVFGFADHFIISGEKRLKRTTVTDTEQKGGPANTLRTLSAITEYFYESANHNYPTKISTWNSRQENLTTTMKYPHDFQSSGLDVYPEMISRNMINSVIEKSSSKSGLMIEGLRTNYAIWPNGIIAPATVEARKGSGLYQTRVRFHAYDQKGNLTSVSKEGDVFTTYVWGYNGTYPVAEIKNASYDEVYNILGQGVLNTLNDLPGTDAQVRQLLAPLRTSPAMRKAQVTTYTYLPLNGMTSSTDANGQTTYYEYDPSGQLKAVKDNHGQIIKFYGYNFKK